MSKCKPIMTDLAHELGARIATVSQTLKAYPDISNEVKGPVLKLAKAWRCRLDPLSVADSVALGAMRTFRQAGFRAPDDIAFVGFRDWKISTLVDPPLSSVEQPDYDVGKVAVKLFLEEFKALKKKKDIEHKVHQLPIKLKIRASSRKII